MSPPALGLPSYVKGHCIMSSCWMNIIHPSLSAVILLNTVLCWGWVSLGHWVRRVEVLHGKHEESISICPCERRYYNSWLSAVTCTVIVIFTYNERVWETCYSSLLWKNSVPQPPGATSWTFIFHKELYGNDVSLINYHYTMYDMVPPHSQIMCRSLPHL